jgi:translation initiation factor IF-1
MVKSVMWLVFAAVVAAGCDNGGSESKEGAKQDPADDTAEPSQVEPEPVEVAGGPTFGEVAVAAASRPAPDEAPRPEPTPPEPTPEPIAVEPTPPEPVEPTRPTSTEAMDAAVDPAVQPIPAEPEPAATPEPLKAGDRINAKWTDGHWYPAKITKVNSNGTFDVKYDDGTKEKGLKAARVRARKPAATAPVDPSAPLMAGDRITAKWTDGYWYPAKITKVNDNGTFDVKYDDGTKEKGLKAARVKRRTSSSSSSSSSSSGGGCKRGLTKCGSRCVDLYNDPKNCFSCGRQCPEACMGGSCVSNAYKYGN